MLALRRLKRAVAVIGGNKRLAFHCAAIFMEILGTLFVLLDCIRVNEMIRLMSKVSFDHEPERFQHWYFHAFAWGFFFLFLGIIFQSGALFFEHYAHHKEKG